MLKRVFFVAAASLFLAASTIEAGPSDTPSTLQDNAPGSLLVFPIFDVVGGNRTKIRVTNAGEAGIQARVTYVCQPLGSEPTSAVCDSFTERFPIAPDQTIVIDVGDRLAANPGTCPTGQGYIVVVAEGQCTSTKPCKTASRGTIPPGEFGPISYNQLYGSYSLYYNGFANAPAVLCGGVPCSPPPTGVVPNVEAASAIAIQSPQPTFRFLGNDTSGQLRLTFGTARSSDYVALPGVLLTDFAAPGAPLIAGPSTFSPFIPPDTVSGTELQTNIVLLDLNHTPFAPVGPSAVSVQATNWFTTPFATAHTFLCWQRIPINLVDPRLTAVGPFGAPHGNLTVTPSPAPGASSPQLLGVIEEVTTVGRTIRTMIHRSTATSPATFVENP